MHIHTCAHDHARANSMCQNFHRAKKFTEKFSPTACIGEIVKNFLLAKYPCIWYHDQCSKGQTVVFLVYTTRGAFDLWASHSTKSFSHFRSQLFDIKAACYARLYWSKIRWLYCRLCTSVHIEFHRATKFWRGGGVQEMSGYICSMVSIGGLWDVTVRKYLQIVLCNILKRSIIVV